MMASPIFAQVMPFARFILINKYLHFANDSPDDTDRLKKLRPVIQYLVRKFQLVYTPNNNICIDESLMKCRGRLSYIQFNPSKRSRFGIKFYKLCESDSGFCWNFFIYCGQDDHQNMLASEAIVLELSRDLLNQGYTIYMDNWYSSPNLFSVLLQSNTYAVGTVRKHRKNMPKILLSKKLKKGESDFQSVNNVLCVKWVDKKDVLVLSTMHSETNMVDTGAVRRGKCDRNTGNVEITPVRKPQPVIDYNMGMGGVDRQDQVLACFPIMRRHAKSYKKIFYYMMDMALFNSYRLWLKITGKKCHYSDFRVNVVDSILKNATLPQYRL